PEQSARLEVERAPAESQAHRSSCPDTQVSSRVCVGGGSNSTSPPGRREIQEKRRKPEGPVVPLARNMPGRTGAVGTPSSVVSDRSAAGIDPLRVRVLRGVVVVASIAAGACSDSQSPAPIAPTPVASTISGVVTVRTAQGDRPASPYPMEAWVESERAFRRVSV